MNFARQNKQCMNFMHIDTHEICAKFMGNSHIDTHEI